MGVCVAMSIPLPPLDPATYYSDNGVFALKVEPSFPDGRGSGECTFSQNGAILWRKKFVFTLRRGTKITNKGEVVGFSYDKGPSSHREKSTMFLWILDSNGNIRYSRGIDRRTPGYCGANRDFPFCAGILLHEKIDTAIFRVYPASDAMHYEKWIVASISAGEEKTAIFPKKIIHRVEEPYQLSKAHAFPERPFFLLDLYLSGDYQADSCKPYTLYKLSGSAFAIMDYDGNMVWIEKNPYDLDFQRLDCAKESVEAYGEHHGFAGLGNGAGEFWTAHLQEDEKRFYAIDANNEIVFSRREKLNRRELVKTDKPQESEKTEITYHGGADFLYSFAFRNKWTSPLPREIEMFDFDERNNAGCISSEGEYPYTYVFYLITPDNGVVARKEIKQIHYGGGECFRYWKNGEWLLLVSEGEKSSRLVVLTSDGAVDRDIGIDMCKGRRMAVDDEKNIVVISNDAVKRFDGDGKTLWTLDKEYGEPGYIFTPKDIAAAPGAGLAALDHPGNKIVFYSAEGAHLGTIGFEETIGREIDYPIHLAVNREGIVYVKNEAGRHEIHKFT